MNKCGRYRIQKKTKQIYYANYDLPRKYTHWAMRKRGEIMQNLK